MKKLLIITLLIFMFTVNCFAAGGDITVCTGTAKAGETVELTVSIKNNPGFCYLRVRPQYDENALELLSVKAGDVYADTVGMGLNISIENGSDMHGDGSIAILTFRVKDGAAPGRYAVDLKFIECYNYDELDVPVSITGGHIEVTGEAHPSETDENRIDADKDNGTSNTEKVTRPVKTPVLTEEQTDKTENGKGNTVIVAVCAAVICIAAAAAVALILNKKKKK